MLQGSENPHPLDDVSSFDDVNFLNGAQASGSGQGFGEDDDVFEASSFSATSVTGSMDNSAPALGDESSGFDQNSGIGQKARATRKSPLSGGDGSASASRPWWFLCGFLTVEYYQPYFNVDTNDVVRRLKCTLMPWKGGFFEVVDGRPDLYGPFWICTTLVFTIAATSNFALWLRTVEGTDKFQHDFSLLSSGAMFVFGVAIAMPVVAWASFHYLGVAMAEVTFVEVACVYGYSLFTFIFSCLLSALPLEAIYGDLVAMVFPFAFSACFLFFNLWRRLRALPGSDGYMEPMSTFENDQSLGGADAEEDSTPHTGSQAGAGLLLLGMFGLHGLFALILKFEYFGGP